MMKCGYGEVLKLGVSIYLVFISLNHADADGLLPLPFATQASLNSDSIAPLISVDSTVITPIEDSEVTEVSSLTDPAFRFNSRAKTELTQERTVESSSVYKPASNILRLSKKLQEEGGSLQPIQLLPAFQEEPEKPESLSSISTEIDSRSIQDKKRIRSVERKLSSPSLPAEPTQIASHNSSGSGNTGSETVPSLPVEGSAVPCELDLLDLNFGGVEEACSVDDNDSLRRRRCCPVLAAWLYSAHAKMALQTPAPQSFEMPVPPDDSQVCSTSLQGALQDRNVHLSPPNASCDLIVCFCGIRLHQIESLNCPLRLHHGTSSNYTQTPMFRAMETNCTDSSHNGCTKCLATLETPVTSSLQIEAVTSKTNAADCRMMGLLWLLASNKTLYLPTVSAVLRAMVYQSNSMQCSLDKENMPLAYDSPGPAPAPSEGHSKYQWSFLVLIYVLLLHHIYI
ncbi:hypothetical protein O6H91_09G065300 [Diphasiastrum complanatum]|uniref:Uncharacterized protein n=1 Tax=Diphasiastrum complanatum TaxID=34168 RepID=A0ACC2CQ27_DIPCM|nr:hypothetical protein O6H91_09G065300 [Diphasiastrum complanatum]